LLEELVAVEAQAVDGPAYEPHADKKAEVLRLDGCISSQGLGSRFEV